jgi:cation transport ATPase
MAALLTGIFRLMPLSLPVANESWRSRVISHVGGASTFKHIGKDAGIAALFALGGFLTSDNGPLKDASPNTKRLVAAVFGVPMMARLELPELQKTWKEREVPDFVMHGLTTAIGVLGVSTNDHDMITSAAMLSALFAMAGHLEEGVQAKSMEGVKALEALVPSHAKLHQGEKVAVGALKLDDHVVVRHGELVPVDGIITDIHVHGEQKSLGAVHMPKALDGEGKQIAVTLNGRAVQGARAAEGTEMVIRTRAVAADSAISRNIHYLQEAEKVPAKAVHSIEGGIKNIYVPIMLAACAAEFAWTYYNHQKKHQRDNAAKDSGGEKPVEQGRKRSTADHVRKSVKRTAELAIKMAPCAIVASMLVIPFIKNALAARHGIMIREDAALEKMKGITHILSDIRGTLTTGVSRFKGLHLWDEAAAALKAAEGEAQHQLLGLIGRAENASNHEIAVSLRNIAAEAGHDLRLLEGETAVASITKGVVGQFREGQQITVGGRKMMEEQGHVFPPGFLKAVEAHGGDVTFFRHARGDEVRYGMAHFQDELRPGAKEAIAQLREDGVKVVLVTGMPTKAAEGVLRQLDMHGATHNPIVLRAECDPTGKPGRLGKDDVVREFSHKDHVIAAIGDAENDAPFMTLVKQGGGIPIAIASTGAGVTKDAAAIVLEGIHQVPELMALSKNLSHALWLNVGAAASWMTLLVASHIGGVHMKTQTASVLHELPTFLLTLASLGESLHLVKKIPGR